MAPRSLNQPGSSSVESQVFTNLDLDVADLGGDQQNGQDDLSDEGDDDGSGFEGPDDAAGDDHPDLGRDQQLDNLRLTQTPERGMRQPPKKTGNTFDAKGNIVGPDGKIVARAGESARHYTSAQKARTQLGNIQATLDDTTTRLQKAVQIGRELHTQLETFKGRETQMQEFGLTPEDRVTAFQLFQSLKRDTAGTIQKLLTRAAANGITINGAGAGGTNGQLDAKSILDLVRQEITNGLKPATQLAETQRAQTEQERKDREDAQRVSNEVQSFFRQNQEAVPYLPVFEKAMANPEFRGMSLSHIWDKIQLNLARNGSQRNVRQTPQRGVPGGRQAPPGKPNQIAPVSEDYGSILNGILDEAGVQR